MERFTGNQIIALVFAGVLFFGGASLTIWPRNFVVVREASSFYGGGKEAVVTEVDTAQSRAVGVAAMLLGGGLATAIFRAKP